MEYFEDESKQAEIEIFIRGRQGATRDMRAPLVVTPMTLASLACVRGVAPTIHKLQYRYSFASNGNFSVKRLCKKLEKNTTKIGALDFFLVDFVVP